VIEALDHEIRRVAAVATGLDEDAFARPARCPPWDVKALLAHMWIGLGRIEPMVAAASPPPAAVGQVTAGAAAYYQRGPRREQAAHAARISAAQQAAQAFPTGHDLAFALGRRATAALAIARGTDPVRIVRTRWGDDIPFAGYLATRVVEVAVHGLDLTAALGREPVLTTAAARVVSQVLCTLLGAEPPAPFSRDPVMFIEAGTGRRPLSAAETAALGPLAPRFPLIS